MGSTLFFFMLFIKFARIFAVLILLKNQNCKNARISLEYFCGYVKIIMGVKLSSVIHDVGVFELKILE